MEKNATRIDGSFIREDGMWPGVSDQVPDHTNQANQASHEMKPVCVSI